MVFHKSLYQIMLDNNFVHITSSPKYAQSNGLAEHGVQIVKRTLPKAQDSNEDPYLALLNYRATLLDCGKSLAELCMERKLRTRPHGPEELKATSITPVAEDSEHTVSLSE